MSLHLAHGSHGSAPADEHARQGVGAVHERGRALEDFHGMDGGPVQFYAVFVAPLLAFLADAVIHHHHAVESQAADDRLGNAGARCNGAQARFRRQGLDNVRGGPSRQVGRTDDGNGSRRVFQFGVSGQAGHHHFIQLKMPEKKV